MHHDMYHSLRTTSADMWLNNGCAVRINVKLNRKSIFLPPHICQKQRHIRQTITPEMTLSAE